MVMVDNPIIQWFYYQRSNLNDSFIFRQNWPKDIRIIFSAYLLVKALPHLLENVSRLIESKSAIICIYFYLFANETLFWVTYDKVDTISVDCVWTMLVIRKPWNGFWSFETFPLLLEDFVKNISMLSKHLILYHHWTFWTPVVINALILLDISETFLDLDISCQMTLLILKCPIFIFTSFWTLLKEDTESIQLLLEWNIEYNELWSTLWDHVIFFYRNCCHFNCCYNYRCWCCCYFHHWYLCFCFCFFLCFHWSCRWCCSFRWLISL